MSDKKSGNRPLLYRSELTRRIVLLEELLLEKELVVDALQDSEKRYRRLFESARDGILILDADTGMVVDVNPFLVKLLGYSYEVLCGQFIWELGVFKDIAASRDAFRTLQENEYIRYDDLPLETCNGETIAVEFVSNVYLVDHLKVIQCNIRDISRRKLADAENLRLSAQLHQAQKMEAIGHLAGGVAHDFNNMLTVIIGYAELALRKVDPSQPLYSDLREIIQAAKHSTDITRQLLAFARKQAIAPVLLDLNQSVASMLKMLRRLIGEDIELTWLPDKFPCPVKMDPVQIDQIMANLCVNARDAIDNIGKVTIETGTVTFDMSYCAHHAGYVAGEYVLLAVSDDGCGMDKKTLGQIFEPFFTSKELGQGTGLGLATVYGIVRQNNGFINVYSEPGTGTTFKIYLPRFVDQNEVVRLEKTEDIPLGHLETVLIVEDEPSILELGKMMLEELGYRVLTAGTPGEAIGLAAENASDISLVITDVIMPEMNGKDMAERLLLLYPNMKILFMSGYTADMIAHRGVLNEGVNFIQKPFSIKELADKVHESLSEGKL